jgi:glycosyltransferase involved in cell wall biosynthesis
MPKVLRIINRFNLGGPTYNAALLTKHLGADFETLLVGGTEEAGEESSQHILDELNLNPTLIPSMQRSLHPLKDRQAYRDIKKIIQKFQPDIVHTHASKAGSVGRLAAFHCKVPVVLHTFHGHVFHSYFGKLKTNFYKQTERWLAGKSDSIVVISKQQQHEICNIHRICPIEKTKVIHLGFNLNPFEQNKTEKRADFRRKYNLKEDDIAIGIVGRLAPIKNHPLFLEAMKKVIERSKHNIRLFIIGDGTERNHLIEKANELNLPVSFNDEPPKTLHFTSWIKKVDWAMAGLDIVTLTSKNEGTPVSLIEAQAAGKPIVSTNVGGIRDIVQEGKTALLSNNHPLQFAELVLQLTENKNLREQFSSNGPTFAQSRFHYEILAREMREHYLELLNKA